MFYETYLGVKKYEYVVTMREGYVFLIGTEKGWFTVEKREQTYKIDSDNKMKILL